MSAIGTTLQRHLSLKQAEYAPDSSGVFTTLMSNIATAAKIVNREVNKAGLVDILGTTGEVNVQGEQVQKLDEYAQYTFFRTLEHTETLCVLASEEEQDVIAIPREYNVGPYVMLFDPLDGSSNIDANVSIGTIFSIYRRVTEKGHGTQEDCLQPGLRQVAAGYIIYGSSTMLVYTAGHGVHGFTLDPSVGEFLLSHPNIRTPEKGKIYSVNEGNYGVWDKDTQTLVDSMKEINPSTRKPKKSARYIGSFVADFHRNLLKGGVFMYPSDTKNSNGKLRLLYEANPLAFIAEQAGGAASNGQERILDIVPTELHQRTPLFIGCKKDVFEIVEYYKRRKKAAEGAVHFNPESPSQFAPELH